MISWFRRVVPQSAPMYRYRVASCTWPCFSGTGSPVIHGLVFLVQGRQLYMALFFGTGSPVKHGLVFLVQGHQLNMA